MLFSDLALSRRLERAEGHSCARFAEARRRLIPASSAEWMECGGAYAVFNGVDSPVTQTFGLGIFEELAEATLDTIEGFFRDRAAPVDHEVSPFAGAAALKLLCARRYSPIEISNVLYLRVDKPMARDPGNVTARAIESNEGRLWTSVLGRGWLHEHPELSDFFSENILVSEAREDSVCFVAELDGEPGAAGALCLHGGVALFGGAATVPEMRRRGLQAALFEARLLYAFEHGCDVAMMAAEPGSGSERNAERYGFRTAYTRLKWRLSQPGDTTPA